MRLSFFFFFSAPPPTEIYTLSLHDALPISQLGRRHALDHLFQGAVQRQADADILHQTLELRSKRRGAFLGDDLDRKSTRLNSSHQIISYAVFCLKKKKKKNKMYKNI